MLNKIQNILGIFILLILFSSCGSINRFTRIKNTPREYSLNYCGDIIKAPKTDLNKKVWVVFSDRANNASYQNPGGKVKMKEVGFLEPFVVIKEKGDFLQIVKYDPSIIDANLLSKKFKDHKKAHYYGWIGKSHLLLTSESVTDIASGFKNKQIGVFSDTTALSEPNLYFIKDSIKTFKDVNLSVSNGAIPFHEIVYTLKISSDRQKTLLAKKTEISPDSVKTDVLGWVHSSLLDNIGQRLHINLQTIPKDYLLFKNKAACDTLGLSEYELGESLNISRRHKSMKYADLKSWCLQDSLFKLRVNIALPLLDQRDNYVFNVNGGKISYSRFKTLEKDLKKVNIVFVFEGKEQILQNFPAMVNVVQNLQPKFEQDQDGFIYKYGSVIAVQGADTLNRALIREKKLTSDYTEFMEHLISETQNLGKFKPLPTGHTWSGVRAGVDLIKNRNDETNLLVIMGEAGYSEGVDTLLLNKISEANCRILGFQLHGEVNNASNNFVLQIENMINYSAYKKLSSKKNIIVYADQLRKQNKYKESAKNVYKLDFPAKSMTPGWILFPEKDATLSLDILTNSIDSLITEIKWDNNNLTNSLYKAFNTVGNHRFRYDSVFVDYHKGRLDMNKKLPTYFSQIPAWYLPSQEVTIPDSINKNLDYHLLLSKKELDELNLFIESVCANEVDYKYKGKKSKKQKICNCPDDAVIEANTNVDNSQQSDYMSTRKIRNKMQKTYLGELKTCKLCKIKTKHLKRYTLAEAQRRIVGCPTYSPLLEKYTIDDIKKKKIITDSELDTLISYIKLKKENLDKYLHNADKFESNGQMYYWIDQRLLP